MAADEDTKCLHHLWEIAELHGFVLRNLSRADLAAMALVCSAFWGHAVIALWEELPHVKDNKHLALIMQGSTRPKAIPRDLTSFTSRTRSLTIEVSVNAVTEAIQNGELSHHQFPGLRSLSMVIYGADRKTAHLIEPISFAFVNPNLHRLCIRPAWLDYCRLSASWNAHCWKEMLKHLRENTGNLDSLSLNRGVELSLAEQMEVGALIDSNPGLRLLSLPFTWRRGDEGTFRAASRLPALTDLTLLSPVGAPVTPYPEPFCSTSLQRLCSSVDSSEVRRNIDSLPPTVKELVLHDATYVRDMGGSLACMGRFIELRVVSLHIGGPRDSAWTDIIQPLLSSRKLEDLELVSPTVTSDITDNAINTISRTWPDLRRLYLRNSPPSRLAVAASPPPKATFRGLASLAEFCPRLEDLSIGADATIMPDAITAVGTKVTKLDIGLSCLASGLEAQIAEYICKMWPNVERCISRYPPAMPGQMDVWDKVRPLLTSRYQP